MNNDLFIDGARVLGQQWQLILELLFCVSWGTLLIFALLRKSAKTDFTNFELTALALGGWPLPALLISLLILSLLPFFSIQFIVISVIILITTSAGFAIHAVYKDITPAMLPPIFIFLILFFLRLGYLERIILPSYFDSAEHYRIIQILIHMDHGNKITWPAASYYHIGYHVIVAAFTAMTQANLARAMLLFGQVILAAIPLPMYFFIRRITGSNHAAVFGVTLAAFGWYMPAHAVNWGKYPALLSLLLIQFTLGTVTLKNRWLIGLSLIASALIHTRAIILFGIMGLAWMLSNQLSGKRRLPFMWSGILLGMTILLINRNQFPVPIFEPYAIWVTLLVGLLSALTFQSFPRLIVFSALAIPLMLAAIFVPVTPSFTLLDWPLVEMILFLPLAFLGGVGAARLPKLILPLLAAGILIHAWTAYSFYPSDCCQLVSRNDTVALDWLDKHLPADARVAIASADLKLDAFSAPMQDTGADAGVWIVPLTERAIQALPYFTDFSGQAAHDLLCAQQVTQIYVGAMPQSFKVDFIETKPEWYETIFFLSKTQIAQVKGCGDGE